MNDILIRQRRLKDGSLRYEYRFEIASIGGQRKWITKSGFKKKSDAQKAGRIALKEYENTGLASKPKEMSVSDFLSYWLENDVKITCEPTTLSNYQKKIRLYIDPIIGKYYLNSVSKPVLQNLLTDMYQRAYARNTIVVVRGIITKSFRYAEDNNYIVHNPATNLRIPKQKATDKVKPRSNPHVYITDEQIQMIFNRFPYGNSSHIPLLLGYRLGLRLGEAFALTWDDVDFDRKVVRIQKQIQWHQDSSKTKADKKKNNGKKDTSPESYWYLSSPKYDSFREIDADETLLCILQTEYEKQTRMQQAYSTLYTRYYRDEYGIINTEGHGTEINFVCRRDNGVYVNPRTLQYTSKIIHTEMSFPEFDFHSLRHTHASMLYERGAPDKFIQQRLGHKKIYITKNVYIHATDLVSEQGKSILSNMF